MIQKFWIATISCMESEPTFETYLAVLRGQPFVEAATLISRQISHQAGEREWDGQLELRTPTGRVELWVESKARVGSPVEATLLEVARRVPTHSWILFCDELPPASARRLADAGVNYVDAAGNCHLALGRQYITHIEGRKAEHRLSQGRGRPGRTEYVLLALFLTRPETTHLKLRELHQLTGLGPTSLSYGMDALKRRGLLHESGGKRTLRLPGAIERWIVGYADVLRPRLTHRRFAFAEADARDFESRAERVLTAAGIKYAWTGGAAAYRLMHYWHGEITALHADAPMTQLVQLLKLVPKEEGSFVLLDSLAPFIYDHGPAPHVAPLPLIYAELLVNGDERARDAARRLREEKLQEWPT